jgi:glucose/arabinose dehydrogenase
MRRIALTTLFLAAALPAAAGSLRFFGNGSGDIDRVKIRVDDPADSNPGPPVDVGAADFTIEIWLRGRAAENPAPAVTCGANVNWIYGHTFLDRDRFNQDRKFGLSLAGGRVVFGVTGQGGGDLTLCGVTPVLDDRWHHVAVQRRRADGFLWLFVDGVLQASADGPDGDVSYPDDGVPGSFCGGPCTNSDPFLVLGAEKHDAGPSFPSFSGWLDELRVSTVLRYAGSFTRPNQPYATDASTAALYRFDEGSGDDVHDASGAAGGPSDGVRRFGGSPAGPAWSVDLPPFGGDGTLSLGPVVSGLASVVDIQQPPDGTGRLFLVEQGGRIRVWTDTQLLATPFLDLSGRISTGGEQGLLGLAFDPAYAANGRFFVHYTDTAGNTVLARYTVSADPDVANPSSAVILLDVDQPYSNHNGGQIAFGPDGLLYMALGDGGSGGDPENRAQDLSQLLGKLLRIDVSTVPYTVPPSNPFVGVAGARGEVWAYGLRNPWKFSFDRLTGEAWIADVGQSAWEEVNLAPAGVGGQNYGWRLMEGAHCYNPASNCNDGSLTLPVLEYPHTAGNCSVTGGFRYRGGEFGRLHGTTLYADFCTGRVWGARQAASGTWSAAERLDAPFAIGTFGEDGSGEIYLASYGANGTLYRLGVSTFTDVPLDHWARRHIESLSRSGITTGCGVNPPAYCPSSAVNRAQVAVFVERGVRGAAFSPPAPSGAVFADVPASHPFAGWIEQYWADGYTGGCATNPPRYCPEAPLTRAQMAVFLLKARFGPGHAPPPASGTVFADVPASHPFAAWIEQLAAEGITAGCGGGLFCPDATVDRAQTAVFLVATFGISL